MPSPLLEANSTSLGGWTALTNGAEVAYGETVQLRLADTAGVQFWSIRIISTDDETGRLGTQPALTVDVVGRTASFVMPASPTNGIALRFESVVGVGAPGADLNFVIQPSYTGTSVICVLAPSGIRVLTVDQKTEGSQAYGWVKEINTVIRTPPGSSSAPSGPASGDLGGSYPAPSVLRVHGASVPIAGALVTGNGLYVSGTSALSYSALNLAGGANYVIGLLPTANLTPGTVGQIFVTTAGPAATWQTAAGDWTGAITANTVGKLKGTTITTAGGALTTGQSLRVTGVATADWGPIDLANNNAVTGILDASHIPAGAAITLAGDVTGPSGANVVGKINGATVPASGALVTGNSLYASGVAALTYSALNLAGGSGWIIGTLPVANGGTGQTTFGVGLLHSNGTVLSSSLLLNADVTNATLTGAKLAATTVAAANLVGGAVANRVAITINGTDVVYGQVDVTTMITGVVPTANLPTLLEYNVADVTALGLLDTAGFTDQVVATVRTLRDRWKLVRADTQTPDAITVVAAKQGAGTNGNWVRTNTPDASWLVQTLWNIDPTSGNDEYDGTATTHGAGYVGPVKTREEISRRMGHGPIAVDVKIQWLGDSSESFTHRVDVVAPNGRIRDVGKKTVLFSGTVSASTAINRGAAYAFPTVTSATGGWSAALAGYVGKRIEITSGPSTGAWAWIDADLGSGSAKVSQWNFPDTSTANPVVASFYGVASIPVAGNTFTVYSLSTVGAVLVTSNALVNGGSSTSASSPIIFADLSIPTIVANGTSYRNMQVVGCDITTSATGTGGTNLAFANSQVATVNAGQGTPATMSIFAGRVTGVTTATFSAYLFAWIDVMFRGIIAVRNQAWVGLGSVGFNVTGDAITISAGGIVKCGTQNTTGEPTPVIFGAASGKAIVVAEAGTFHQNTGALTPTINGGLGVGRELTVGTSDATFADMPLANIASAAFAVVTP